MRSNSLISLRRRASGGDTPYRLKVHGIRAKAITTIANSLVPHDITDLHLLSYASAKILDELAIDNSISRTIQLFLVCALTEKDKDTLPGRDSPLAEFLSEETVGDKDLDTRVQELTWIWRRGLLKILLTTYFTYFRKDNLDRADLETRREESKAIFALVSRLAFLSPTESLSKQNLEFRGETVKLCIVPVEVHRTKNILHYSSVLSNYADSEHMQAIFLIAAGATNIDAARQVSESFLSNKKDEFKELKREYAIANQRRKEIAGLCIALLKDEPSIHEVLVASGKQR